MDIYSHNLKRESKYGISLPIFEADIFIIYRINFKRKLWRNVHFIEALQKYKILKIMMKGEKCENDKTSLNSGYKTTYKEGKEVNLCR